MITRLVHNDDAITLRVPNQLKIKFIEKCKEQNLKYQSVIKELMEDYVETSIKELEQRRRERYLNKTRIL